MKNFVFMTRDTFLLGRVKYVVCLYHVSNGAGLIFFFYRIELSALFTPRRGNACTAIVMELFMGAVAR